MLQSLRIALVAASFGLLFGFSTASIAGVLESVSATYRLTTGGAELMVTTLVISAFAGAVAGGPASGRLGRRPALMLAGLLAAAGYAVVIGGMVTGGPGYTWFLLSRALIGLGVGLSSAVAPMFVAETTPARRRGALVALFQVAVTIGILLAYATAWGLHVAGAGWQAVLGCGMLPEVFGLLSTVLVPESPRWYLRHGAIARARDAATRLGTLAELDQAGPQPASIGAPQSAWHTLRQHLRRGSTAAVLAFCGLLFVLQNLSGIDGILYYAPHIFGSLGFSGAGTALAATVGLGAVNMLATCASMLLVDRLGRRPLMIWGSFVMAAGLACVILAGWQNVPLLGLAGLCIYLAAFALSLGPLPYVLMSELVPGMVRDAGIAAASATSWLFNALVAFTFLTVVERLGVAGTFGIFTAVCLLSAWCAVRFVPETRGVALEKIEVRVLAGRRLSELA